MVAAQKVTLHFIICYKNELQPHATCMILICFAFTINANLPFPGKESSRNVRCSSPEDQTVAVVTVVTNVVLPVGSPRWLID